MTAACSPRSLAALAGAASALCLLATSAAGASSAPAPPNNLSVTASDTSSVSVGWRAPADPTVVAYAYFLNGTRIGAVPTLHRTLTDLACGTTYAVGVDAYNAAQIHSQMVVVNAATAPCPVHAESSPPTTSPSPPPQTTPPTTTPPTATEPPTTTPPGTGEKPPHVPTPPPVPSPPAPGSGPTSSPPPPVPSPPLPGSGPTPSPAGPNLVVAIGGSDSNPCSALAPCASFDRAYHVAKPGDTVRVSAGSYPLQTLTYDATKAGATTDVVFQAAAGALARLRGLTLDGTSHVTFVGASSGDLSNPSSGLTLSPTPGTMNSGGFLKATNCASHITAQNLDMESFFITGADHITIRGGTVGGVDNGQLNPFITGPYQGRGTSYCSAEAPKAIVVQNVLFHDVLRTNFPAGHPDCLQIAGTTDTLLDGNRFVRCGTADVMVRPALNIWAGNIIDNLVIQNNSLTPPVEGSNVLFLGGPTDTCGAVSLLNNTSTVGLSSFTCSSYKSLHVIGNHMNSMSAWACSSVLRLSTVVFDSNAYLVGPTCGTHGINGP
jgi:hypothetical protein